MNANSGGTSGVSFLVWSQSLVQYVYITCTLGKGICPQPNCPPSLALMWTCCWQIFESLWVLLISASYLMELQAKCHEDCFQSQQRRRHCHSNERVEVSVSAWRYCLCSCSLLFSPCFLSSCISPSNSSIAQSSSAFNSFILIYGHLHNGLSSSAKPWKQSLCSQALHFLPPNWAQTALPLFASPKI